MPNIMDSLIDYSRQLEMNEDLGHVQRRTHFVIGCGGIGYWTALLLAMMGAEHIILIDGERIENTNMNRIPASPRYVGKLKINALKAQIRVLRPMVRITCVPSHITPETLSLLSDMGVDSSSLVWDCTDDARIQLKIYNWCTAARRLYVKLGYEGWKIGMYRHMSMWIPDNYRPGYTTTRSNALTSIVVAAMGIMYVGRGFANDVEVDLKAVVEGRPQGGLDE